MLQTLNFCLSLPLLYFIAQMLRYRRDAVAGTTLMHAWIWMILALSTWIIAQVVSFETIQLSPGWQSWIGYFSLTLLFAPFVSVLGAKRPGYKVWDWFIVLPMILVLNWPVIASGLAGISEQSLDLEGPALMGSIVVLVMILGNYFGTIFTPLAIILGGALICGLTGYSQILPQLGDGHYLPRIIVSVSLLLMLLCLPILYRKQLPHRAGYQRVWLDFRDWFGVLWSKRLMDRLNQTAETKKWPVRFSLDGIDWQDHSPDGSNHDAEIEHTLRWLFRRFTDDAWIDRRLDRVGTQEFEREDSTSATDH